MLEFPGFLLALCSRLHASGTNHYPECLEALGVVIKGTIMVRVFIGMLMAVLGLGLPAAAQDLAGMATAVNADHIMMGETTFALYGIDAPEPDQANACFSGRRYYGCYDNAKRQLETLLSFGPIECNYTGTPSLLGIPYMTCGAFGEDIAEEMVLSGFAFAFRKQSDKYVEAEETAQAAQVGLWQPGIRFDKPWDWRVMMGRPIGP